MIAECSEAQSFPYPRNVVAGVIDDRQESVKVVKELERAGFADSDIHLFHGEEAAECIDATGEHLEELPALPGRHKYQPGPVRRVHKVPPERIHAKSLG